MTQAHKVAPMHTICLHAQAHVSAKLGWIREIKVSLELGEYARPLWAQKVTQAHKLACMHALFLHAQAHISAKLGQIRVIKLSMESGKHTGPLWAYKVTQAHKLVSNFLTHLIF